MRLDGGEAAMHRSRPGSIRIESSGCEPGIERTLFQSPGQVDRSMGRWQPANPDLCRTRLPGRDFDGLHYGSWVMGRSFPDMVIDELDLN